jgi:Glycosyl hydrolases family 38 N-terminal domain/Alpha mannosidase middle domain
MEKIPE